jgi:hypothetical protein
MLQAAFEVYQKHLNRPPSDPQDDAARRRHRLEANAHNEEVIRRMRESHRRIYVPSPPLPEAFEFAITENSQPPPDVLREDRQRAAILKDRSLRARSHKATARPDERLPLDVALYRKWHGLPSKRKQYEQALAAIGILADLGRRYVDSVTEDDWLAVVKRSLAEGLSPGAVKFRLACLSMLGVKGRRVYQIAAPVKD